MSDLTEFLLARIAEDEDAAQDCGVNQWVAAFREGLPVVELAPDSPYQRVVVVEARRRHSHSVDTIRGYQEHIARHDPARVLAECEAHRRIVELHEAWPVLVQRQPKFETVDTSDPGQFAMRASQQIMWATEQEYRAKFGDEPPTAPMIAALAAIYADHPDYREEWRP